MGHDKEIITSFTDLKCKDVINICDGARLGRICDIELEICDCNDVRMVAIVLPGPCKFFGIIRSEEELVISCRCIKKIGDDVILVELPAKD